MTLAHVGGQRVWRPVLVFALFLLDWLSYLLGYWFQVQRHQSCFAKTGSSIRRTAPVPVASIDNGQVWVQLLWGVNLTFPKCGFICFCNLSKGSKVRRSQAVWIFSCWRWQWTSRQSIQRCALKSNHLLMTLGSWTSFQLTLSATHKRMLICHIYDRKCPEATTTGKNIFDEYVLNLFLVNSIFVHNTRKSPWELSAQRRHFIYRIHEWRQKCYLCHV